MVEDGFACLHQTFNIPVLIDELFCDVFDDTRFTKEMPAILHIEEALHIKIRVESLLTLKALNDVRVSNGYIIKWFFFDLHDRRDRWH